MFNIEIPKQFIEKNEHNELIDISSKEIIGLMGYAKSGKDYITNLIMREYKGYNRLAFGDYIKIILNKYLKDEIISDVNEHTGTNTLNSSLDFFTENLNEKQLIRPYLIWFGEKLREINGPYYWINKAFDNCKYDKIIISDVRRLNELDLFKNFNNKLYHVIQYGLDDNDVLTKECILEAYRYLLVNGNITTDPRISENKREEIALNQIYKLSL